MVCYEHYCMLFHLTWRFCECGVCVWVKHVFVRAHYFFSVYKHITVFCQVTQSRNKKKKILKSVHSVVTCSFCVALRLWMLWFYVLNHLQHQRAANTNTTTSLLVSSRVMNSTIRFYCNNYHMKDSTTHFFAQGLMNVYDKTHYDHLRKILKNVDCYGKIAKKQKWLAFFIIFLQFLTIYLGEWNIILNKLI